MRLATDPSSPLITFYDDATGDRVELSAATFANWVAKTANLLVDGLGLAPGDRATVRLPMHWQALVVVAGCLTAGLEVTTGAAADGPAVAFGTAADALPVAADLVLLSLRPLGRGLEQSVAGVWDYAVEVPGYGDRFVGPIPAGTDLAIDGSTHAQLGHAARAEPRGVRRILLAPDGDPYVDAAIFVNTYLAPLAGGGSIVLCRHCDPATLDRRAVSERATLTTLPY